MGAQHNAYVDVTVLGQQLRKRRDAHHNRFAGSRCLIPAGRASARPAPPDRRRRPIAAEDAVQCTPLGPAGAADPAMARLLSTLKIEQIPNLTPLKTARNHSPSCGWRDISAEPIGTRFTTPAAAGIFGIFSFRSRRIHSVSCANSRSHHSE